MNKEKKISDFSRSTTSTTRNNPSVASCKTCVSLSKKKRQVGIPKKCSSGQQWASRLKRFVKSADWEPNKITKSAVEKANLVSNKLIKSEFWFYSAVAKCKFMFKSAD